MSGSIAQLRVNLGASPTLNLNQQATLKTLSIGDTATPYTTVTVASGSGGSLVFSSTTGTTIITKNNSINGTASTELRSDIISATMSLMLEVFESQIQNTTGSGQVGINVNPVSADAIAF